jgi:hypothetical protein
VEEEKLDEFSVLADEPNFGNVAMCPGGVVHINLAHVSLKMDSSDFRRLSVLIAKAGQKLAEQTPRLTGSSHLHVVPSNNETPSDSNSQD